MTGTDTRNDGNQAGGRGASARFALALGLGTAALELALALAAGPAAADIKDAHLRGLLDVVGAPNNTAVQLNTMNANTSNFDAYGLRLFAEGKPADELELFTQVYASDVAGLWMVGAYGLFTPKPDKDLHLEAGKIPWPIGTWAPRTYSDKNPLVGVPLMYQYHTSLPFNGVATSTDEVLSQAGKGESTVTYGGFPFKGMPIVYDRCWDVGLVGLGSFRPVEFSVGVTNGTPSDAQPGRDNNKGKSFMGRVGVTPLTGLRVGVSGSIGPYLSSSTEPSLPAGAKADDFDQRLVMADLEYLAGHAELHAEGVANTWETPYVGNLSVNGYYVEGKYTFPVGLYLAARWDQLYYSLIQGSSGPPRPWDDNVSRFEGGAGYRVLRPLIAKVVYQYDKLDPQVPAGAERRYDLMAAAVSLSF
jgi:hypothetical protein